MRKILLLVSRVKGMTGEYRNTYDEKTISKRNSKVKFFVSLLSALLISLNLRIAGGEDGMYAAISPFTISVLHVTMLSSFTLSPDTVQSHRLGIYFFPVPKRAVRKIPAS